jgi:hypothetical protein
MSIVRFPPDAKAVRYTIEVNGQDCDIRTVTDGPGCLSADLTGILHDLQNVKQMIELAQRFSTESENQSLVEACWVAAVILYRRCFKTGVRCKLDPEKCFMDKKELLHIHNDLIVTADKNIAHSVNLQEQNVPFVALFERDGELSAYEHGIQSLRQVDHEAENLQRFRSVVEHALIFVGQQTEAALKQFDALVGRMTPQELTALPVFRLHVNVDRSELSNRR